MRSSYTIPVLVSALALACTPEEREQPPQVEPQSPAPDQPATAPEAPAASEAPETDAAQPSAPAEPQPAEGVVAPIDNLDTGVSVFGRRRLASTGASVEHWRVDGKAGQIAAGFAEGCGIWMVESGAYQGFAAAGAERDPCADWPALEPIAWSRGQAEVTQGSGDARVSARVEPEHFEVAGTKLSGDAGPGQRYLGAAFDPKGEHLALLIADGLASKLQLWSVAEAALVRELSFPHPMRDWGGEGREAVGAWLHWGARSLAVVVEVELDFVSERERFAFVHVLPEPADPSSTPRSVMFGEESEGAPSVVGLYVDRDRSVFVGMLEGTIPDDGGTFHAAALASLASGEVHGWSEEDYLEQAQASPAHTWSDAVGSSAWNLDEVENGYEDELGWYWSIRSLTPLPAGGVELSETRGSVHINEVGDDMSLSLVGRGQAVSGPVLCPVDTDDEEIDPYDVPPCPTVSALPSDCALVDGSWDMRRLLLACGERWLSVPAPRFGEAIDVAAGVELARGTDEPRAALWGPSQLALWTEASGLRVVDVDTKAGKVELRALADVTGLRRAILDEELERALVLVDGAPRVVELAAVSGSGEAGLGPALTWSGTIEHAAFAPDGQRVALAGAGVVAVFDVGKAAPLASWTRASIRGIAFRQDGAVLYLGEQRAIPELAFDPATGALARGAQLDAHVLTRLEHAGMDPSWRWAIDRDGVLLRALDGHSLLRFESGKVLADNGLYAGDRAAFEGFIMRAGPPGSGLKSASKLPASLERADLLETFLAGQPLR